MKNLFYTFILATVIVFIFTIGYFIGSYITFLFQIIIALLIYLLSYLFIYKTAGDDGGVIVFFGIIALVTCGILLGNIISFSGIDFSSIHIFK